MSRVQTTPKHQIWQSNSSRTSATLIANFFTTQELENYLKQHIKCPENQNSPNNDWHDWNDALEVKGIGGDVRSMCDFCGLIIADIKSKKRKRI